MKRRPVRLALVILVLVALGFGLAGPGRAGAQSGGGYDLTWSSVDGGGLMFSTGGGYSLGGTIGQADAGILAGGGYTLHGGFWAPGWRYSVYLPLVLREF